MKGGCGRGEYSWAQILRSISTTACTVAYGCCASLGNPSIRPGFGSWTASRTEGRILTFPSGEGKCQAAFFRGSFLLSRSSAAPALRCSVLADA
jgi:hypothetical protein